MKITKNFIKGFLVLFSITILLSIASLIFGFYNSLFGYVLLGLSAIFIFLIFRKKDAGFWFELPKYVFLILLIAVAISSLNFDFIDKISLLKTVISFLKQYQLYLTIATIAFGAITFYMNRDIIDEVENEKDNEEKV